MVSHLSHALKILLAGHCIAFTQLRPSFAWNYRPRTISNVQTTFAPATNSNRSPSKAQSYSHLLLSAAHGSSSIEGLSVFDGEEPSLTAASEILPDDLEAAISAFFPLSGTEKLRESVTMLFELCKDIDAADADRASQQDREDVSVVEAARTKAKAAGLRLRRGTVLTELLQNDREGTYITDPKLKPSLSHPVVTLVGKPLLVIKPPTAYQSPRPPFFS